MKIWDTAGSEKYMSISTVYYRKADGVVFIFDVTKPRSFTNIETIWMNAVDAPERLGLQKSDSSMHGQSSGIFLHAYINV